MNADEKAAQVVLRALHRRPAARTVYIGDWLIKNAGIEAIERQLASMGGHAPHVRSARDIHR